MVGAKWRAHGREGSIKTSVGAVESGRLLSPYLSLILLKVDSRPTNYGRIFCVLEGCFLEDVFG